MVTRQMWIWRLQDVQSSRMLDPRGYDLHRVGIDEVRRCNEHAGRNFRVQSPDGRNLARDSLGVHPFDSVRRAGPGRAKKWWRWGRVELPVQKPSPETTTSVSDDLSSIARTAIGSLPSDPVTSPFGL
jgi:hypothetical protein